MPIDDWTFPASIITPEGTLNLNDDAQVEGCFFLLPSACVGSVEAIRAEKYGIPNADGSYLRRRFTSGYGLKLAMNLAVVPVGLGERKPACTTSDPTATEMLDLLMLHLRSILNGGGRFLWTPRVTGSAQRLLDDLWLFTPPVVTVDQLWTTVTFDLDTRFPYAIDFTQIVTSFSGSDSQQFLDNTGTSPFWPVWKIYGPSDGFHIVNQDTLEEIVYDKDLPGASPIPGGSYLEIDTFRNTAYLNGNGADFKPGIDVELSTFFPLAVGVNDILVTDDGSGGGVPDVDCLWQAAWF